MSVDVSQVPSDCEELVEESFRFSDDFLEKKTPRQRMSKPPHSPKSPYLTSLNMNPRRAAVAAWRLPRASLGGSREGTPGDRETGPGRSAFLSNGHDVSPIIRAECNVSPELLIKNFRKQQRLLHSAPSGFSSSDFRDKEDMYEEIIRLKKTLHAHKSDNRQTRAKVRRLEEENTKREKQIEELLDPTKGAEFTRSLVDKKRDGSVVVNGLKQRILKLEQQCREKENALSRLQSELRTTRLEELKITAQTYFEEIQRLKMLLEAAERSCRAESKCSQRQQRALNSSVLRLTERVSQLQQENSTLREELSTEYPPGGLTGYRDWSKQRLLRRLLELERVSERRPEDKKRPAHPEKSRTLLDQEAQTWPFTMATEAGIAVATMTEGGEEESALKVRLGQWEDERAELQERLRRREEELERAKSEGEKREKEREEWKTGQTRERDEERQRHKEETEALWTKLQTLEEERERAALSGPLSAPLSGPLSLSHGAGEQLDDRGGPRGDGHSTEARRKERAARAIQRGWRAHRDRDVVLLQSVLRGHLHRRSHLEEAELSNGLLDLNSLLLIQAALRGHLTRSGPSPHSWTLPERSGLEHSLTTAGRHASSRPPEGAGLDTADTKPRADADHARTDPSAQATHSDSDDSDNIIVSPSRPIRRREVVTA